MKFLELKEKKYKYIKYIVRVECTLCTDQKLIRDEKEFTNEPESCSKSCIINDVCDYISRLKEHIKNYPELYPNAKIFLERIKTESTSYEVLEGI